MGRPNSLIFMHPTRSLMDKRGQQIFMPRPNSMMNAIKGKEVYKALMRTKVRNTNCHYWENNVVLVKTYWSLVYNWPKVHMIKISILFDDFYNNGIQLFGVEVKYWKKSVKREDICGYNATCGHARTYLQPHYGNEVFGNVYLSAGQH